MKLIHLIEQHWQQPKWWLTPLLYPLSRLFAFIIHKRRNTFLRQAPNMMRLAVPIAIIGNLHAGGSGKTPLVQALALALREQNIHCGIISRGYGRKSPQEIHLINDTSSAEEAGDEPLLLWQSTRMPVAVGANRLATAQALLAAHPEIALILSDDGLQHYRLPRDYEIIVFPADAIGKPNHLLPHGALREPLSRLQEANAVYISRCDTPTTACQALALSDSVLCTGGKPIIAPPYQLGKPDTRLPENHLHGRTIAAACAIAQPERFFHTLATLGIQPQHTVTLPDHHTFTLNQLPEADICFITEKDAVKINPKEAEQAGHEIWVIPIRLPAPEPIVQALIQLTRNPPHGSKSS